MGESWTPAPFGGRIDDPFGEAPIRLDLGDWRARARGWRRFRDWLDAMIDHGVSPNIVYVVIEIEVRATELEAACHKA